MIAINYPTKLSHPRSKVADETLAATGGGSAVDEEPQCSSCRQLQAERDQALAALGEERYLRRRDRREARRWFAGLEAGAAAAKRLFADLHSLDDGEDDLTGPVVDLRVVDKSRLP